MFDFSSQLRSVTQSCGFGPQSRLHAGCGTYLIKKKKYSAPSVKEFELKLNQNTAFPHFLLQEKVPLESFFDPLTSQMQKWIIMAKEIEKEVVARRLGILQIEARPK